MKTINFSYEANGLTRQESISLEQRHRDEAMAAFRDRDYTTANKLIDTANSVRLTRKRQESAPSCDFGNPPRETSIEACRIVNGMTAAQRLGIAPKKGAFWQ